MPDSAPTTRWRPYLFGVIPLTGWIVGRPEWGKRSMRWFIRPFVRIVTAPEGER